ncbi:tyrosine-type recombinase/integrase [Brevibacillus daliensis]|uniref:tyrosine-type recombinase/integrase n=1 Tax=Brevibacillus daliensis TaxID=2892995 RepID=UPI001E2D7DFE|nr:tyrosine-type recombinase/integrase [Brevibacillus daliensis]
MECVEALKDIEQINSMKRFLKDHSERDYLLFVFGINTGLNITEILEIKVQDVLESEGIVKDFYLFPETDSKGEKIEIFLNRKVKTAILDFLSSSQLSGDDYLFQSSKTKKAITRQQAYRIIHHAAEEVGIEGKIGTNSMRKTFGYHAYKRGVSIALIQKYFHHATPSETLKFLGLSKSESIRSEIDVDL